jgi:hypothetical protein
VSAQTERLAAGRAVFAKLLMDEVSGQAKKVRRELEASLVPGEKVKAQLPDGRVIGVVQLTEHPESVTVTDPPALLEYVKRTRPDEVVVTETIRDSFLTHLRDLAKVQLKDPENTDGLVVDRNGEVIPGLELDYGTPRYTPTPDAPGRRVFAELLAELLGGRPLLPELEAAE